MDLASNKKKNIIYLAILAIIFTTFSIFLTINLYGESETNDSYYSSQNFFSRTGLIQTKIEEMYNIELNTNDLKEISEQLYKTGNYVLFEPTKYENYLKVPFEFVILKDKIVITRITHKYGFELGLTINEEITKINDKNVKDLDYDDIFTYFYTSEEDQKVSIVTNRGSYEITICGYNDDIMLDVTQSNSVSIKLYNLDQTTAYYVYKLVESFANVTIDLSQATITNIYSFKTYLSLFSSGNEVILTKPETVNGIKSYKLTANVNFILGSNSDLGIKYFLSEIKSYGLKNVSFDSEINTISSYYSSSSTEVSSYVIKSLNKIEISNKKD